MSDIEKMIGGDYAHFANTNIRSFGWKNVTVTVKERQSRQTKRLLDNVQGVVKAGELLAIMGPSGSGKSTLLKVLAQRYKNESDLTADLFISGAPAEPRQLRCIAAYVEQGDALVGSLTVHESLDFAARLALPRTVTKFERMQRIEALIVAFGLRNQKPDLVGTSVRNGISLGQKRRVSVATQLITRPKLLLLDEPLSDLDSEASFQLISFVKDFAKRNGIMVIISIQQPPTSTFAMSDKLLLLSQGRTAYSGSISGLQHYFDSCGFPIPRYMNPAEFIMDFVNTGFARDKIEVAQQLTMVHSAWEKSLLCKMTEIELDADMAHPSTEPTLFDAEDNKTSSFTVIKTLMHRSLIKSYRDIIAYGIRVAMYLGLAVMMGTIWLRLSAEQANIQSFINAIFFGGAFMSLMAVAYIPSYLEDHSLFLKDHANGLYGPFLFILSNFLTGVPFLFLISLMFSVVAYWLSNFQPTSQAFVMWNMWLFLDLLAAESLVVLVSSLVPISVVALAAVAFVNGLWMCTGGFLVPTQQLNPFWRYLFHYVDYQSYVFQGMMVNEFGTRDYACPRNTNGTCAGCLYDSVLKDQCLIQGTVVLDIYGYPTGETSKLVGIMFSIIFGYRLLGWAVLHMRRR